MWLDPDYDLCVNSEGKPVAQALGLEWDVAD